MSVLTTAVAVVATAVALTGVGAGVAFASTPTDGPGQRAGVPAVPGDLAGGQEQLTTR
jgi:hypothetical protein